MIRWDVIRGNLPLISAKIGEHIALTLVAVAVGFVLSFAVVLLVRDRRRLVGPVMGFFGFIYTIPSLALLAFLVPFTRLSFLTSEIALVGYTLLILARNLLAGLDGVPADVLEAADAMGYTRARRLWQIEIPLALPLIVAGIRIATVTTIGLVMVTALIGFGGLGQVMLRGYNFRNDTLVIVGFALTVAMAVAVDLALGWLGRAITPWSRARAAAS
ncbi:MAG TPA: ABC transporter permease [Candidatus Limnocylindrales bacterium]|nr:ABC transporter permease [Candidatus Limnocylindrales bacterium]